MKKIIVPVDFSKHSEYALETAAVLAKKNKATLIVLHMLELSSAILTRDGSVMQEQTIFFLKLAEKKFEEFLDKKFLKRIKVIPIVKQFKVFSEVNEVAKEHEVDLIVMGSHGVSGIKEMFIGSNTEKVVRYSDIPVLVVKHNPILTDFESVVFACDFSEKTIKPYLEATKMFKKLGAKLHLLYVNLPNERFKSSQEMENKVANFLKKAEGNLNKINEVTYVSDYSVEKGILNFSNIIGADLIATATHGRTGLAHFIDGSISEDIANHSTLPVMTFKI
ncbi:MAG: universal stress protein [Flavobacteriaceae bacterium]|nr:universal stress protein [Flavobacteriaceae bacterium]